MGTNKKDELIIEYFNDNSNINLFNENFVKNNRDNVFLEIDGEKYELRNQYKFKNNEDKITVKLIVKENIYEINMSEMFSNCNHLISLQGI